MTGHPEPIERRRFATDRLMAKHRPVWGHPNKRIVFEIACPAGCVHHGELAFSRWARMPLPERINTNTVVGRLMWQEDVYDYAPVPTARDAVEWHVNFADPHLFVAYGSSLFAQDEIQVAEHPAIGALREALDAKGAPAVTVENGQPTPVVVMGAERRCHVATDRNAAAGRPQGLYGNAFARADANAVRRATTRIDPPTVTNLTAMAAPSGGRGAYHRSEIDYILSTAYTGFRSAVLESKRNRGDDSPVMVHSGFWGCGAFGGNRVLMALLQALAAELAGLERLVMHTFDATGTLALERARVVLGDVLGSGSKIAVDDLIERIVAREFEWGTSDGN